MGMDVFGNKGNYFRANIWSWRTICYAMELAGYDVPVGWGSNDGEGLDNQEACNFLADKVEHFLKSWDGEILVLECKSIRVTEEGRFVDPGTPGSKSPYSTSRGHLKEFVKFLRECGGFQIW